MKPHDKLLERYHQAKALLPDGLPQEPPPASREIIMRSAREQTDAINSIASSPYSTGGNSPKAHQNTIKKPMPTPEAANDSFWSIKALASIAVMGLSALIWWQFEQGTPQERVAAKTAQPSPATVAVAPPAAAPDANSAAAQAPTASIAQEADAAKALAAPPSNTTQATKLPEPERQQAAKKPAPLIAEPSASDRARTQDLASASSTAPSASRAQAPEPPLASAETAISDSFARSAAPSMPAPVRERKDFSAETASAPRAPNITAAPMPAPAARAAAAPKAVAPNPLLQAIQERDAPALRQALSNGASPNTRTPDGNPALTQAVLQRWGEGVRILLAAGADRQAKNNKGHTAADVALELGYSDMTELLVTPR